MIPMTPGETVTLAATTASARVALPTALISQVMVTNAPGAGLAFVSFGNDTVSAAVASSTPILPGVAYVFTVPSGATHMAAITGTGSATLYATVGQGG